MEKMLINKELEKIANLSQKQQKNQIQLTNAQALRMIYTKAEQMKKDDAEAENLFYQKNHWPKLHKNSLKTPKRAQSMKKLQTGDKDELPPLKRKNNEQENEIIDLMNRNLLFDKKDSKAESITSKSLVAKKGALNLMLGKLKDEPAEKIKPENGAELKLREKDSKK